MTFRTARPCRMVDDDGAPCSKPATHKVSGFGWHGHYCDAHTTEVAEFYADHRPQVVALDHDGDRP